MRFGQLKRPLRSGSIVLGVLVVLSSLLGPIIIPGLNSAANTAYAQGCPGGNQPVGGFARVGVCLSQGGNQLTTASGYTVTVTQKVGTKTNKIGTTFANGFFITNSAMPPIGQPLGACTGNAAIPYQLTITATKGTNTFSAPYNACNDNPGFIYRVTLPVSSVSGLFGSVKGCITYTAPDGTTQPFNGSPTAQGSPATATITGPSGASSKTITVGFDASGCLTGPQISNLPVGNYTIDAVYAPGQTPQGRVGTLHYHKAFTIIANQITDVSGNVGCTTAGGCGGGNGNTANAPPSCEGSLGPLGWIVCSVFNIAADASQWILTTIIQPFLVTAPVSTDPTSPSYKVWSNFRVYGDIFLVFALLVIVFGQSIGGGLVDAYTAKKVLPRLLIAAILINLSVYIVALLVDLTNILGEGVGNLITEPLRQGGQWNFQISAGQIAGVFTVGLLGLLASAGAIITGLVTFFAALTAAPGALVISLFFILLPMILSLIAVFVTLLIRKGIILLLLLISPVAFALYCLPNTEKYFRKWWDALVKTLLVYPIVMIIFAVADVLSVTILTANSVTPADLKNNIKTTFAPLHTQNPLFHHPLALALTHPASLANPLFTHLGAAAAVPLSNNPTAILAIIVAFIAQFVPLFLIPFSFRLAGGVLGQIHNIATTSKDRLNKMTEGRRQYEQKKVHDRGIMARQNLSKSLIDAEGTGNKAKRRLARFAGNRVRGWQDIELEASKVRAEAQERAQMISGHGRDEMLRADTVNKEAAERGMQATYDTTNKKWIQSRINPATGKVEQAQWRMEVDAAGKETGRKQYRTLGGAWTDEAWVDLAHRQYRGDVAHHQEAVAYEIQKAQTEEEFDNIAQNYHNVAQGSGSWGMSDEQAGGAWMGATFKHQGKVMALKYTDWQSGELKKKEDYARQLFEQVSAYPGSQQASYSMLKLKEIYQGTTATDPKDEPLRQMIEDHTEVYMHDAYGAGQQIGDAGGTPVMAPPTPLPAGTAQAAAERDRINGASGSAHYNQRVRELEALTKVDKKEPTGSHVPGVTLYQPTERKEK